MQKSTVVSPCCISWEHQTSKHSQSLGFQSNTKNHSSLQNWLIEGLIDIGRKYKNEPELLCNLRKYEKEINEQKRKHKKGGKKEEEEKETRENVTMKGTDTITEPSLE